MCSGCPTTRCTCPRSWWPTSSPTPPSFPHGLLLAGDGIARFPDEFAELDHAELAGPEFAAPSVAALVALATARAEREEFEQPADLRPLYLRQSDAEIAWGARTGTVVG